MDVRWHEPIVIVFLVKVEILKHPVILINNQLFVKIGLKCFRISIQSNMTSSDLCFKNNKSIFFPHLFQLDVARSNILDEFFNV